MSKINCNYHSKNTRSKECAGDINERQYRQEDKYNPMKLEKEYVKALNATKLDKLMSKPLVGVYMLHNEGINKMQQYKNYYITSSYSNEVIIWDLLKRKTENTFLFDQIVNTVGIGKNAYVSQGKSILVLDILKSENNNDKYDTKDELYGNKHVILERNRFTNKISTTSEYKNKIDSKFGINCMDVVEDKESVVIGTNNNVNIYNLEKNCFLYEKKGGVKQIQLNRSISGIVGGISESEFYLEDVRANKQIFNVSGSFNCFDLYENRLCLGENVLDVYDMRNLDSKLRHFKTSSAVVSCSMINTSNTQRITVGTMDQAIYNFKNEKLQDIYHNKRMSIIHGIKYSACGNFIVSGSDDGNIRVWKTEANQKLSASGREQKALSNAKMLQDKFKDVKEIERIRRHKHLNKELKTKLKQMNKKV